MKLFAIDFDHTIVDGHTHNTIAWAMHHHPLTHEEQWDLVKEMRPVGNHGQWTTILKNMLAAKHAIAIVSFNQFPHIISRYLRDVIQLTPEELAKIHIIAHSPAEQENKNAHLQEAIAGFQFTGVKNDVILIDDSLGNVQAAELAGYKSIYMNTQHASFAFIENFSQTPNPSFFNGGANESYCKIPLTAPKHG